MLQGKQSGLVFAPLLRVYKKYLEMDSIFFFSKEIAFDN